MPNAGASRTIVRIPKPETLRLTRRAARLRHELTRQHEQVSLQQSAQSAWEEERFVRARYDPNRLLEAFPTLRLRPGYKLASYQHFDGANGNGFVFALPVGKQLPDPAHLLTLCPDLPWTRESSAGLNDAQALLKQVDATQEVLRFLQGDGSPLSFFEASILARELAELGAIWHGESWSTRTVLTGRTGFARGGGLDLGGPSWQCLDPRHRPKLWSPVVTIPADPRSPLSVRFYTYTGLGQQKIEANTDLYPNWSRATRQGDEGPRRDRPRQDPVRKAPQDPVGGTPQDPSTRDGAPEDGKSHDGAPQGRKGRSDAAQVSTAQEDPPYAFQAKYEVIANGQGGYVF